MSETYFKRQMESKIDFVFDLEAYNFIGDTEVAKVMDNAKDEIFKIKRLSTMLLKHKVTSNNSIEDFVRVINDHADNKDRSMVNNIMTDELQRSLSVRYRRDV